MESYIMSSVELDQQFIDNASDDYMSDEEREYWIEEEEGVTEEKEEVEIELCDDIAFDNAYYSIFGYSLEDLRKIRKAKKKALVRNIPNIPTSPYVEHRQEMYRDKLANHFNRGIK